MPVGVADLLSGVFGLLPSCSSRSRISFAGPLSRHRADEPSVSAKVAQLTFKGAVCPRLPDQLSLLRVLARASRVASSLRNLRNFRLVELATLTAGIFAFALEPGSGVCHLTRISGREVPLPAALKVTSYLATVQ